MSAGSINPPLGNMMSTFVEFGLGGSRIQVATNYLIHT